MRGRGGGGRKQTWNQNYLLRLLRASQRCNWSPDSSGIWRRSLDIRFPDVVQGSRCSSRIHLGHFDSWRWDHYIVSKSSEPVAQWRVVIHHENGNIRNTAAENITAVLLGGCGFLSLQVRALVSLMFWHYGPSGVSDMKLPSIEKRRIIKKSDHRLQQAIATIYSSL
jgi:hypothetical protein